jgi:hypothetical protein
MAPPGQDERTEHFWDTEVRLLSGHGSSRPGGLRVLPSAPADDSDARHASRGQLMPGSDRGRRQDAPSLPELGCGSPEDNPGDSHDHNLTQTHLD